MSAFGTFYSYRFDLRMTAFAIFNAELIRQKRATYSMLMGHMIGEYRSNQKAVTKNMLKAVKYDSLATGVSFGV